MNAEPANPSEALTATSEPAGKRVTVMLKPNGERWTRIRWITLIILTFIGYMAFIIAAGDRKKIISREIKDVPVLKLANSPDELLSLSDPTLFALPHQHDFAALASGKMPEVVQPTFRWSESPRYLSLPDGELGAIFRNLMETNFFGGFQLEFKPSPKFSEPMLPVAPVVTQNSTLRIEGALGQRKLLSPMDLPSLTASDVIAPTKIQALVDAIGNVVSVVLLESSGLETADQRALELARDARFSVASHATIGRMVFTWHTVPFSETDAPSIFP
jgi:hypothetical protein